MKTKIIWVDCISKELGEIGWGGMDWIRLAQDRDQWRTVVNSVIGFLVHTLESLQYVYFLTNYYNATGCIPPPFTGLVKKLD
jgi:hypothetical protein